MTTPRQVAVLVGSLRKASLNLKMANALIAMAPPTLKLAIVEIGALPLYNEDWEVDAPPAVLEFRRQISAADAVLFVTPEYNRTLPGGLKNAIDIGSRPGGKSVWGGKPGAVVSVSPGIQGAVSANHNLRQSMVFLDVPILQQPEMYIGQAAALFDDSGALINDAMRARLEKFLLAFARWIERNAPI